MLPAQLKTINLLLLILVGLASLVVFTLAFQLTTNKDELLGLNQEFGGGTTEEAYCAIYVPEEVMRNETGRALFKNNCIQCHDMQANVVGPPLAGVQQRHSRKWLHYFVQNSSKMIEEKDSAAVAVYLLFGKQQMPSFDLTTAELDSLFDYIAAQPGM